MTRIADGGNASTLHRNHVGGHAMRTLLGRANSSNVMKVIWLLEELGLPYERVDVGGPFGGTDTPDYLAKNPNRVVPTLVEDGFVLWESNAILRYLATAHPTEAWPADPHRRALVDQWMDWQQTVLNRPQSIVFQGLVRQTAAQRDMTAIGAAKDEITRHYGLLNHVLQHQDYVAGDAFTLADIALGVHVHRWFAFDFERPGQPALQAWYQRLLARPVYAAHVARPLT